MAELVEKRRSCIWLNCYLKKEEDGFSLIELLVSISILTVIMAGMFSFLWGASKHWTTAQNSAEVTENARLGLNRMTRELKQASNVTAAQTDEVTFTVDFGDGAETISYGFKPGDNGETGTVWRNTSASPGEFTLINDVETMQFNYFGSDYKCDTQVSNGIVTWSELQACSATPATKISRVDISLTLQAGTGSSQAFVEQAWLRNRLIT